jgi:hypothetical protein
VILQIPSKDTKGNVRASKPHRAVMEALGAEEAQLAVPAQRLIAFQSQFVMPLDLSYPASEELMAALPTESVMIVAIFRNTGRLPVTIQRCQWQTSQPGMIIERPGAPPSVAFPHRLGEHDQCISIIDLASIMSILDAPLRDKSVIAREAWPRVEVANRREPVRGNRLTIPTRNQPSAEAAPAKA